MSNHKKTYADYLSELHSVLHALDMSQLDEATSVLVEAFAKDKVVFVAGNGGSAATASHLACDFAKTTLGKDLHGLDRRMRSISLSDNMPMVTAYGNDVSYESIFSEALRTLARAGDVLIVITASGNSPNILAAIGQAKKMGVHTIGFLGFEGGKAGDMVDCTVLARSTSYGVIEDCHSIFMHMLTEHLKEVVQGGNAV